MTLVAGHWRVDRECSGLLRQSTSYDDVYREIAYINAITWYKRVYDSDSGVAALRHFVNYPSQVAMGFSLLGAEVQGMMVRRRAACGLAEAGRLPERPAQIVSGYLETAVCDLFRRSAFS